MRREDISGKNEEEGERGRNEWVYIIWEELGGEYEKEGIRREK